MKLSKEFRLYNRLKYEKKFENDSDVEIIEIDEDNENNYYEKPAKKKRRIG